MKVKSKQLVATLMAGFIAIVPIACGGGGGSNDSAAVGTPPPVETPTIPTITTQPAGQTVAAGQTATFSVTATGTAPLNYQWKKGSTVIPGATSSTYTTPAISTGDVYSVVVSNSAGTVTSNTAQLTVSSAVDPVPTTPTITTQPAAQTVAAGQTATFSVTATGTAPLNYQWKKGSTVIPGATSSTYTTPAISTGDVYSVVVSNSAGTVTSSTAQLTVSSAVASVSKLPHTGITASQCFKAESDNLVSCSSSGAQALNSQQDGHRTSINAMSYSLVPKASGGTYDKTECVKDDVTGLIWEGKTASGTRAGSASYTNYDSTASAQKSNGSNPTQAEIDASTNSMGYVNTVNSLGLCGFTDWRMPTVDELQGIVDYATRKPSINSTWFPNTQSRGHWASSPYVGGSGGAWYVYFHDGYVNDHYNRNDSYAVRLVRASQ